MEDKKIGLQLRFLNNKIRRYVDTHLNKKAVDEITGTNGWIISFLANSKGKDVFQKDVEAEFGVTRSTASKVINLMEQKGLILRESVPYDARLKKLTLTDKAEDVANLMIEDGKQIEAILTNGFTNEELDTLSSYIARMRNNIDRR